MTDREGEETTQVVAYDELDEDGDAPELEADPSAPMINDETGAILDRLWEESQVAERRAMHNQYMNARIRQAFGKGG